MSAWFCQAVEISTQLIIPYNNNFPDKFPYSPFFLPLSSPKRIYQHKTPWTITFTVSFRLFFVQIYQSLLKQGERGGRSYRRPPVSISGNTKPIPGCLCAAYQPRLVEFLSLSLSLSLSSYVCPYIFPLSRVDPVCSGRFNPVAESRIVRYRNARAYTQRAA